MCVFAIWLFVKRLEAGYIHCFGSQGLQLSCSVLICFPLTQQTLSSQTDTNTHTHTHSQTHTHTHTQTHTHTCTAPTMHATTHLHTHTPAGLERSSHTFSEHRRYTIQQRAESYLDGCLIAYPLPLLFQSPDPCFRYRVCFGSFGDSWLDKKQ